MNTDLLIAEYLANWLFNEYQIILAPSIQDSFFPAFEEYPGSSSLSEETSLNYLLEKCCLWHKQGAKQFYILNTGISTNKPLLAARNILNAENISFNYFDMSQLDSHPKIKEITQQKIGTHADEIETSLMLCIHPEVVLMSEAKPEESPKKPGPLTRDITSLDKTISVTGAWGNPTLAMPDKGKIILHVIQELIRNELTKIGINQ